MSALESFQELAKDIFKTDTRSGTWKNGVRLYAFLQGTQSTFFPVTKGSKQTKWPRTKIWH